jgi:hypothetical protein
MRTESAYMMIAIGLALGEQVSRVFGNGEYWMKATRRSSRMKGLSGAGARNEAGLSGDDGNYLEKIVTEYEIIPLMSKLI